VGLNPHKKFSLSFSFDAGFISEQTGIIVNNEIKLVKWDNATTNNSADPRTENTISSMAPSIIVNSCTKQVRLIIGGTGNGKAITSVAYVSTNNT
jgi:gamma-glutamyltranspeptidase